MKLAGAVVLLAIAVAIATAVVTAREEVEVLAPATSTASPVPAATPGTGDDEDRPLSPEEAKQARAAALRVTGGGTVAELDRSDDPGEAYEVEIIEDGREYDVALDLDFRPVPNRRYDD